MLLAALSIAVTSSTSAHAYTIGGPGLFSCEDWTADRTQTSDAVQVEREMNWVIGFLSGVGYSGKADPLAHIDSDGVWNWVDIYCKANPSKTLAAATIQFSTAHPR